MNARAVVQGVCVVACLTGSVAGAEGDPALALYLPFDDLARMAQVWTAMDSLRHADVYRFAGVAGRFTAVENGDGRALRAASPGHLVSSDIHPWDDERIPVSAMSVLMWSRLEGRLGDVSFMVSNAGGAVLLRASSGTGPGEGGSLIYSWTMYSGRGPAFSINEVVPPSDSWVFYAATFDERTERAQLFVDGELVAEAACDAPIPQDWDAGEGPFSGAALQFATAGDLGDAIVVDDLSVWTRALSPLEIRHAMQDGPLALEVSAAGKLAASWGELKSR